MQDEFQSAAWYRQVIEQYESRLIRYATRLLGNADRARDVVQDTFLKLCRNSPDDVNEYLAQWLYSVCRNRALDIRKKEARMKEMNETESFACVDQSADHTATIATQDLATRVKGLMQELTANQREVVRLKFEHELSYKQISHITDLSVSNIGYLIHTAIQKLRTKLNQDEAN